MSSADRSAAIRRAKYTGESYSTALQACRISDNATSTIPEAADRQALLETDMLLALNSATSYIFGGESFSEEAGKPSRLMLIRRLQPRVDSIVLEVGRPELLALVPALLPYSESPSDGNIMGIPGLRAAICGKRNRLLLERPAQSGKVYIQASGDVMLRSEWRKLLEAIRHELGSAYHIWHESPTSWTAAEWEESRYAWEHRSKSSWLCSGILRRLNIFRTSGNPTPRWVDVWDSHGHEGVNLQVEWPNGPSISSIHSLLLDGTCGMSLKVTSEGEDWSILQSTTSGKLGRLVLRHNLALSDDSYSPD